MQLISRSVKGLLPKGKRYRKLPLGPAAGCVMAVDFGYHLKVYLGIYEYELLPHLKRMVTPGANCFDIGGRDGYDALMMANMSRGRVASFECEHVYAEQMRHTFAQNPKLSIEVVESFVGAENAHGCTTIDQASRDLFVPHVIKLDIEGAEDRALEGASETLAKYRPHFIIEVPVQTKKTYAYRHCGNSVTMSPSSIKVSSLKTELGMDTTGGSRRTLKRRDRSSCPWTREAGSSYSMIRFFYLLEFGIPGVRANRWAARPTLQKGHPSALEVSSTSGGRNDVYRRIVSSALA